MLELLTTLVGEGITFSKNAWEYDAIKTLSGRDFPDIVTQRNHSLLKADVYSLWLRWFIEGICSPTIYVEDAKLGHAHVLADVRMHIDKLFSSETKPLRDALSKAIANYIMEEVGRLRNQRVRISPTREKKVELIYAGTPRCWICGFAFSEEAIDRFLKKPGANPVITPPIVDILRPRGLNISDVLIEVDHVLPVASGGLADDNLALACGWCNRYKSSRSSIYDVSSRAPRVRFSFNGNERFELPHPFWAVRILAMRPTCEHRDGCEHSNKTAELFIAPSSSTGAPNPSNLHVYCSEHDPFSTGRLVSVTEARKVWADRKKQINFAI